MARINAGDRGATLANHTQSAVRENRYDYDHDSVVDADDDEIVEKNLNTTLILLSAPT